MNEPKIIAVESELKNTPQRWLVTGVAGFIGSNILERLLKLGQEVVGLDNLATGFLSNLEDVRRSVGDAAYAKFKFIEGDICDLECCSQAVDGARYVLHQAALGSVGRSIKDPLRSHQANVNGFLNILLAAKEAKVERLVYASSSSVYGDSPILPKKEDTIGAPLSPYAATKRIDEIYAAVFGLTYGLKLIGLRYFNVFGPRQNPNGDYAAVIPRWIGERLKGEKSTIFGDGLTSRDFCYVQNAVDANILAALSPDAAIGKVFNIAVGEKTSLDELYGLIDFHIGGGKEVLEPLHSEFRAGDVRHSLADVTLASTLLGYSPRVTIRDGLGSVVNWYKPVTVHGA